MADIPRILVVDDEADVREVVQLNLSREGFEVATAPDGESALNSCVGSHSRPPSWTS